MKHIILAFAFLTSLSASAGLIDIEGTIKTIHLRDVCLVEVQTKTETVAFLTDLNDCHDYQEEMWHGRGVVVVTEDEALVTNPETLALLKKYTSAFKIFAVEFGSIENGLADEASIILKTTPENLAKCSAIAEKIVSHEGQTKPAQLVEINSDGHLVFNVRANLHGGDSAHEVVLTQKCKFVSKRVLWAE